MPAIVTPAFANRIRRCVARLRESLFLVWYELVAEVVSLRRPDQAIPRHGMRGTLHGTGMGTCAHVSVGQHYFVRWRVTRVGIQHNGFTGPRSVLDDGTELWCGHTEALHRCAAELKKR